MLPGDAFDVCVNSAADFPAAGPADAAPVGASVPIRLEGVASGLIIPIKRPYCSWSFGLPKKAMCYLTSKVVRALLALRVMLLILLAELRPRRELVQVGRRVRPLVVVVHRATSPLTSGQVAAPW